VCYNSHICFHLGRVNVGVIVMAQSQTRSPQKLKDAMSQKNL
jgi:hypothetical protein